MISRFFLDAAASAGVSIQSIPTAKVRINPVAPTTTINDKEAHMGTMNLIDVKAEAKEASGTPKVRRTSVPVRDLVTGKITHHVKIQRVLGSMYTKPLIDALGPDNPDRELAADEVFMRLRHGTTLQPHNRRQLQAAMDKFMVEVPEWVDPVAIAVAENRAKAEKKAKKAKKAKKVKAAAEAVKAEVAPSDEVAELRSQVAALTAITIHLATELGVEVPA